METELFMLTMGVSSPSDTAPIFGALAALSCMALFHRLRDLIGPGSREKGARPSAPPRIDPPSHADRLSNRSAERPRSVPVNPEAVEFFLNETRKLKEANGSAGYDELLQESMEAVCNAIGAERVTIFLSHSGGQELMSYLMAGAGSTATLIIPSDKGIAGEVLRFGSALVVNDLYDHADFYAELEEMTGVRALNILAAPLKDALGGTSGVFQMTNKPGGFSASDQALLLPYVSALADSLHTRLSSS